MSKELDKLDRLAAEHVMGWKLITYGEADDLTLMWETPHFGERCRFDKWQPTRSIAQAWECLEKTCKGDPTKDHTQFHPTVGLTHCNLERRVYAGDPDEFFIEADTAPLAIVKACLKAKGVE